MKNGSKIVHRARLNFYGYLKAGKSSLFRRLTGKSFDINIGRTKGIDIHAVKIKGSEWNKETIIAENIDKDFSKGVAEMHKETATQSTQPPRLEHQNRVRKEVVKRAHSEGSLIPEKSKLEKKDELVQIPNVGILHEITQRIKSNIKEEGDDFIYVWDFGGQAEYYATHHLFVGAEAVHLIVMDVTKNFNTPVDIKGANVIQSTPTTPAKFLCYWLHSIHTESSKTGIKEPSVAIFLTHIDQIEEGNDAVEHYKNAILDEIKGKPYADYITIDNIHDVDNTSTDENHFNHARSNIMDMIRKQKSWEQPRPLQWLRLEADIRREKDQTESAKYLKISDVQQLASKHGMNQENVNSFLEFQHTMGEFNHFSDEELKDYVIVDPQWLVDRLKALISPLDFIKELPKNLIAKLKEGRISERNLHIIWKGEDVVFLRRLLEKFDLLISCPEPPDSDTDDTEEPKDPCFLIASILPPVQQANYEEKHFKKENMVKVYSSTNTTTQPLPVGTFHTLVSKCSKIEGWNI